jgi:hypothetical protein
MWRRIRLMFTELSMIGAGDDGGPGLVLGGGPLEGGGGPIEGTGLNKTATGLLLPLGSEDGATETGPGKG